MSTPTSRALPPPAVDEPLPDNGAIALSIVVPVYNEEENVDELHAELTTAAAALGRSYEVVVVDDGSTDDTYAKLKRLAAGDPRLKVIHFGRNFGQTAAMAAGFDYAEGAVIVPLDGDLQNDPADIALLLNKLDEGYDVVSGWRKDRKDNFLRRIPSRLANWLIGLVTGVHLHDYGCTLKAYRATAIQGMRLYGEMHRFLPALAYQEGARVTEVPGSPPPAALRPEQVRVGSHATGACSI